MMHKIYFTCNLKSIHNKDRPDQQDLKCHYAREKNEADIGCVYLG